MVAELQKALQVDIPDSKAVVSTMGGLLTQAKGRPGPESEHDDQTTVNISLSEGNQRLPERSSRSCDTHPDSLERSQDSSQEREVTTRRNPEPATGPICLQTGIAVGRSRFS